MNKQLRHYLNEEIARWMETRHPEYPKIRLKLKGTCFVGCPVFYREVDSQRKAWIVLGAGTQGIMDALYWTTSGMNWEDRFPEWYALKGQVPPPPPPSGAASLTEDALVGQDIPGDGARYLDVEEPTEALRDLAMAEWKKTETYRRSLQLAHQQIRQKNPQASDEEILAQHDRGNRGLHGNWSAVGRLLELDEKCVREACDPV